MGNSHNGYARTETINERETDDDELVNVEELEPEGEERDSHSEPPAQVQQEHSSFNPFSLYFGTTQLFFTNDPDEEVFGLPEQPNDVDPLSSIAGLSSKVARTTVVKSPINLNKTSLQLVPREEPGTYNVQFIFDCTVPCNIRVFFFVKESTLPNVPYYTFGTGLGQYFVTDDEYFLNTNDRREDELKEVDEGQRCPVLISIEALPSENESEVDSKEKKIVSQTTYATLLKCADDTFEIKPLEQKVIYGGITYIVHDIYGIDHNSSATPDECVICMTEMRNTVVIPCRHMCVCHQCAQVLRYQSNKCPICRGAVRSMVKIKIRKDEKQDNGESESDEKKKSEEILLLKTKKKNDSITMSIDSNISDREVLS